MVMVCVNQPVTVVAMPAFRNNRQRARAQPVSARMIIAIKPQ